MYSITLLGIIIAVFSITALMGEINAWVSGELAVVLTGKFAAGVK